MKDVLKYVPVQWFKLITHKNLTIISNLTIREKKKSIYLVLFLNKSEEDKYANAMLSIGKAFHMY